MGSPACPLWGGNDVGLLSQLVDQPWVEAVVDDQEMKLGCGRQTVQGGVAMPADRNVHMLVP
jgi:hypothetical protein